MKAQTNRVIDNIILNNPQWIYLIPKFDIYRFLGMDGFDFKEIKSKNKINYKPIILINGYKSSHVTWNYLAQRLWNLGFRNIFALELHDFTKPIIDLIHFFDTVISLVLEMVKEYSTVSLISHSIGGIFARYYVKYNERSNIRKVSLLITIASPYYEILTFLRNFGFIFNHIFPRDMIRLFEQENGLYSLNNSYQPFVYNRVIIINVDGTVKSLFGSDGLFKPQYPCELINIQISKNHFQLLKSPEIYYLIKELLFNKYFFYNINLRELIVLQGEIHRTKYIYFRIKDAKIDQRYPTVEKLKISSNKIGQLKPLIIFTGMARNNSKNLSFTISLFAENIIFDKKLFEEHFKFDINQDKEKNFNKTFKNNSVMFSINIILIKL